MMAIGVPRVTPKPHPGEKAAAVGLDGHPPSAAVSVLPAGEFSVDGFSSEIETCRHPAEHADLSRTVGLPGGGHAKRAHTRLPLAPRTGEDKVDDP